MKQLTPPQLATLALASIACLISSRAAVAADEVELQLEWVTQAQFAGDYVAQDQDFHDEAYLDATIKPVGPDIQLIDGSNGALNAENDERTVQTLLAGGSDRVISKEPEGAWSAVVTDKSTTR